MKQGVICVFTLNRIDELKKFLTAYHRYNNHSISIILAKDMPDAHRIKTLYAFYSPYDYTISIDTDILINGDLDDLFSIARQGKIGIVREKGVKCLNSGVLVFPTSIMKSLCEVWNMRYEEKLRKGFTGQRGTWDQDILNFLLLNKPGKYPFVELSSKWNHIIKDYSPAEELAVYDDVKIFHFLHAPDIDRNKYKSYQEFMKL